MDLTDPTIVVPAYSRSALAHWERWCDAQGLGIREITPESLLAYVHLHRDALGWGHKTSVRVCYAIAQVSRQGGGPELIDDDLRDYFAALARAGTKRAEAHPVDPLDRDAYIAAITAPIEPTQATIRLRAALYLGRAGFSHQAVARITGHSIEPTPRGLRIGRHEFDCEHDAEAGAALEAFRNLVEPRFPHAAALRDGWARCRSRARMSDLEWGDLPTIADDDFAWLDFHADCYALKQIRDRAYLAAGWSMARRHDCLTHIRVTGVAPADDALEVHLPRSKTDQLGKGMVHAVPHLDGCPLWCPACLLDIWLAVLERLGHRGLLFPRLRYATIVPGRLTTQAGIEIVRGLVRASGADLTQLRISTRSMRIGAAVEAAKSGKDSAEIARSLTLHANPDSTVVYIRSADPALFQFHLPE